MGQVGQVRLVGGLRRLGGLGGLGQVRRVRQGENCEFWILNWVRAASLCQRGVLLL
ncbi:hypothetical protein [Capnocytophaga leadbetteri]|uniref:hypothetical protein n=1 Tax=Capnocytophaga leadbetteri TaxID=327575 RepID=UPI0028D69EA8|nr:hypothetical protein [Capnocytophaga leadbetteri]